jgi:hypothetical protein
MWDRPDLGFIDLHQGATRFAFFLGYARRCALIHCGKRALAMIHLNRSAPTNAQDLSPDAGGV